MIYQIYIHTHLPSIIHLLVLSTFKIFIFIRLLVTKNLQLKKYLMGISNIFIILF
jgi:hypothetical protein